MEVFGWDENCYSAYLGIQLTQGLPTALKEETTKTVNDQNRRITGHMEQVVSTGNNKAWCEKVSEARKWKQNTSSVNGPLGVL